MNDMMTIRLLRDEFKRFGVIVQRQWKIREAVKNRTANCNYARRISHSHGCEIISPTKRDSIKATLQRVARLYVGGGQQKIPIRWAGVAAVKSLTSQRWIFARVYEPFLLRQFAPGARKKSDEQTVVVTLAR